FPARNLNTSSKERSLLANASINSLLRSSSLFFINFSSLSNSASYLSFAFETTSLCVSIFSSIGMLLLLILLSFLLYLHKVLIQCVRLYPDTCRCHVKCLQDLFLCSRNRIIHTVSTVTLADQHYLIQFPDRCQNGRIVLSSTLL